MIVSLRFVKTCFLMNFNFYRSSNKFQTIFFFKFQTKNLANFKEFQTNISKFQPISKNLNNYFKFQTNFYKF